MEYSSKLACLLALAFAMAAALVAAPCAAQNSPQDYVYLHNAARAEVGVGLGNVSWDDTLEAYAQSYADQRRGDCQLVLSDRNGGQYGENLFTNSTAADCTAADAVNAWVSQVQYYDYGSNTCSGNWSESCGLYTQVVWRNTTAIGCACDVCDNDRGVFTICSYYPAAVIGQSPY